MELLKSGNFSVHYHDNGSGSIYENRFEYEDFQDMEGNDRSPGREVFEFGNDEQGYLPYIVKLLVEALGGKCGSA